MRWVTALSLVVLIASSLSAADWRREEAIAAIFSRHNAAGAFAVYDAKNGIFAGYNRERAQTRFVPASTFKIANSLLGLASGAVESVDSVIPFVGEPGGNPVWEKDMSLREGIAVSNVLLYQELARRIGLAAMTAGVRDLRYGNCEVGDAVDTFWLRGPLAISATEQCLFLDRLANKTLPLPADVQNSVIGILELERGDGWILYGKTGYMAGLGWWVGWVLKDGRPHSFALNMDIGDAQKDLPKRLEIGKACLAALGLLPR